MCQTQNEAVYKFLKENIAVAFDGFDSHRWRVDKYWNEECDTILKKYLPVVKELFKKYSGKNTQPGKPKFVSMEEFIQMVNDVGVVDDTFGAREIGILYNLAMFTQVDEIDEGRHMEMFLDEFIDALGRVADRLGIASPYDADEKVKTKEELMQLPTHIKLKNFIELLLKRTMRRDFRENIERKVMGILSNEPKLDPELAFKLRTNTLGRRAPLKLIIT